MKKWFWALLAVWMIAGSFSVTIRADRVVGNENGDISDGAGDIPNASGSSSEIKVMVSDVASRYAVDVTFPQLTVVFGEVVWNVDDCRYEIEENDPGINRFDIQVTNHIRRLSENLRIRRDSRCMRCKLGTQAEDSGGRTGGGRAAEHDNRRLGCAGDGKNMVGCSRPAAFRENGECRLFLHDRNAFGFCGSGAVGQIPRL